MKCNDAFLIDIEAKQNYVSQAPNQAENLNTFAPIYPQPQHILFKAGDDLRQDMLTLQMLSVLDSVWSDSKLDLHLKPYSAMATGINKHGEGVGMLVFVTKSTINSINVKYGGAFNAQTID